ncbi:neurofilament light polypeptide-like isoform X1 [Aquila chrysaetos chrysaetos]|uniref:neurofilament light polypeptide-like isoform X1 n=1 Tax=Aquila chrysaetos chrysaetos TaxID=223781 RepID=UPI00117662DF|nr:neurofilament light polypeptide-like isoform X1 [Aquila chrysaetos chrysaetos]
MSAAEGWPRYRWGGGGEAVLRARAEAAGYRRLLRARAAEVEALRGAVGALHRQLEGLRDRRSGELAKYQGDAGGRRAAPGLPGPAVTGPQAPLRDPAPGPPGPRLLRLGVP